MQNAMTRKEKTPRFGRDASVGARRKRKFSYSPRSSLPDKSTVGKNGHPPLSDRVASLGMQFEWYRGACLRLNT